MNRIRAIAQVVGFCTIGLLALYGLLTLSGGTGLFGFAVRADPETPSAPGKAAVLGGTIPQTMNYQGFLRDPDGSLTTGSYTITARIYDQAAGGTKSYQTTVPNVTVRDGLFNIVLGDAPPLPDAALSEAPRYIGIDLNDGAGELIPRQRLHAVPWAFTATTASTATTLVDDAPAQRVQGLYSSGNVGIGIGPRDDRSKLSLYGWQSNGISATLQIQGGGGMMLFDGNQIDVTESTGLYLNSLSGLPTYLGGELSFLHDADKPVLIKRMENIGPDYSVDTGISSDEYECVVTGWSAKYDIDEAGSLINCVWTFVKDSHWRVKVQLASHNDHENPDVDILCFRKDIAEWQGDPRTLWDPD